jgi:ATP/maltotriose-dependent transcriptional regulator MalT
VRTDDAATTPPPAHGARLLEREQERAWLRALTVEARGGEARIALIEGPAGIGKSRLLAEARREAAAAGMQVLSARGGELEREFPFGVVRQLFEPLLYAADARERLLEGAATTAQAVFEHARDDDQEEDGGASFATLHGLYWLTSNVAADGPLLLSVDDLHWCDRPSLRFLAFLARRLEGLPVLVAGSLRPSEPGADAALLHELASDPLTVAVRPRPLSAEAVADVIRDRLGAEPEPAFADACHSATGGNPLLLQELLRELAAEGAQPDAAHVVQVAELGPRAASRSVLIRLARLPGDSVAVARAAAVLGDGAESWLLAGLAGLDEDRTGRAVAALTRAEVLQPDPPVRFVHPLVRAAVYRDVPPGERELQHERAAALLREAGASVERTAAHLLHASPRGDAAVVDVLSRAAREALHKGAPDGAVAYYERALAEPPAPERRGQVLLELGSAEVLTQGRTAAEHLRQAADHLDDPVLRGRAVRLRTEAMIYTGQALEAGEIARAAAAELGSEQADLRTSLEAMELNAAFFAPGTDTLRRLEAYRDLAVPRSGLAGKLLAGTVSLDWAYRGGSVAEVVEYSLAALEDGELVRTTGGSSIIGPLRALSLADAEEAMDGFDAWLEQAHQRGSLFAISTIHLFLGDLLRRRGELAEATDVLRAAVDEFALWGSGRMAQAQTRGFLAMTLLARGDVAGARRTLQPNPGEHDFENAGRYAMGAEAEVLLAEGRAAEALEVADEFGRRFPLWTNPAAVPWRALKAEALDRLGRADEAVAVIENELVDARIWGAPGTVGRSLRLLGTIRRDEGIEALEEAVAVLDGTPARLELARALAALGSGLRRGRRPAEAREPLQRALDLAEVVGAAGLVEHIRSELYAAGARPRGPALHGPSALTASERRVALMAAEGRSNRDIAQTLFVTPKTVEVHLSATYRKLQIRSRRELAGALAS